MKSPRTRLAAPALPMLDVHGRRTTRTALARWIVGGVALMASAGLAVEVPQLEALKKEYEERTNTGDSFFRLAVAELNAKYVTRIKREQEIAQKAGNLDDALKFDQEGKLIGGGGDVPEEDESGTPAALKKIRATYRAELAKLAAQRGKNDKPLQDEYRKKLEELVIRLTKEGKLEEATAVKSYRESHFSSSLLTGGTGAASAISGKTMSVNLPNDVVMKFVFCPPGEFEMGSPPDEPGRTGRENQVEVKLTKGFWIAETECTQKQWTAITGSNPSQSQGDNLPVEMVSWNDANGFIAKLNQGDHLPKGLKAVLPTEAQWEYACRAGTKTAYSFGKSLREKEANFGEPEGKEVPVASYPPNKWGLYDMHGNVCEFCLDYRVDKLPGGEDPKGPAGGEFIIHRGGSWFNGVESARSAARSLLKPTEKCPNVGFRVVCNVE